MRATFTRLLLTLYVYACVLAPLPGHAALTAISQQPLFIAAKVDPNVMFALSVEWPTAETAAYSDASLTDPLGTQCPGLATDSNASHISYVNSGGGDTSTSVGVCYYEAQTYLGYFDAAKCYAYDTTNHYFYPSGSANSSHQCSGYWSGNLLNWATMTTLDEFRWATTGGARDVDTAASGSTPGTTILKRTFKYRGPNQYTFRIKRLTKANTTVGSTSVPGVQTSKVTPAGSDTTLYFGNQAGNLFIWSSTNNVSGIASDNSVTIPSDASNGGSQKMFNVAGLKVRIKVCDANIGLETNCAAYVDSSQTTPVSTYKPTGLIQSYAASMRFAVASYLYDSSAAHNGGVLRSNMKYVGAVNKTPADGTVANLTAEWSDTTGVFAGNPNPADATASGLTCSAGTGCSGVVNYINGFGYSAGNYMSYDNVSELYYEALRYFVNPANGPTQTYVTAPWNGTGGLDTTEKDGFPAVTSWQDPIQYSCQKNVIVTIGDSNTWCDFNLPGSGLSSSSSCSNHNSYSLANQRGASETWANVATFANTVGGYEGKGSLGTTFGGGPSDSYFISGLAWWAHTNDIRADSGTQDSSQGLQNITSFFIDVQEPGSWGSGGAAQPNQYWLAAKYGGFTFRSAGTPDVKPMSTAAWSTNGTTPSNYMYGGKPLTLINSLSNLFATINGGIGSLGSLGTNSTVVQTGDKIFQGEANTTDWSGHLLAYDLDASGNISTTYVDAASTLAAKSASARVIFSYNDATQSGVPFEYANLSTSEQAYLPTATLVNFIRGDNSNEGTGVGQFRVRTTKYGSATTATAYKLGDIIDSTPAYVGRVQPDGVTARTAMVYVGANDGMLHAFSAGAAGDTTTTSGSSLMQEKFAYVPSNLMPNLPLLAAQGYSHQYYVDGNPKVAEAMIGTTATTVLAGTERAGGRGVFALDVTNPDTIFAGETQTNASKLLIWEFSNAQDADLGYTYSDPQIVKTAAKDANGRNRWAVVLGNGYNSTGTGQASVFVIFLDQPGTSYLKLTTQLSGVSAASPNGMGTPKLISADGSGVATTVYAGDLKGNLWKFDISDPDTTTWGSPVTASSTTPPSTPTNVLPATAPLYTATTTAGVAQPITTAPEVVKFPRGGWMLLFGTGQAFSSADFSDTTLQGFYGIRDDGSNVQFSGRSALQQQQILSSALTHVNPDGSTSYYREITSNLVTYPAKKGWYLDLRDSPSIDPSGERLIFNPNVYLGRVAFTTVTPSASTDTVTCLGGGASWNMELDPYTGAALNHSVFDVNKDQTFSGLDAFTDSTTNSAFFAGGIRSSNGVQAPGVVLVAPYGCGTNNCHEQVQTGANGVNTSRFEGDGASFQRLSWREITNG
jgi:type IV pilus assembly protein PilY1